MTYEELKRAWVWALRECALPMIGSERVEENLGLRSMNRVEPRRSRRVYEMRRPSEWRATRA